jgi:hypothetical protein
MTPFGDTKFHSGVSSKKTQKETFERKEGEEAPVESQGKNNNNNLQSHSKGKIRSNCLFVATAAAAQEPSLERERAQSASSPVRHCSSVLLGLNLDLRLRARH